MKKLFILFLTLIICIPLEISCNDAEESTQSSIYSSEQECTSSNLSSEYSLSENSSSSLDSSSMSSFSESSSSISSSSDSSSVTIGEECTITYWMCMDNTYLLAVKQAFWKEEGHYPTNYVEGIGEIVDALKDRIDTGTYYIEFLGWYLDKTCTVPFDGVITETQTGDLVLYAKTKSIPY